MGSGMAMMGFGVLMMLIGLVVLVTVTGCLCGPSSRLQTRDR
jgi:hypothetical protein